MPSQFCSRMLRDLSAFHPKEQRPLKHRGARGRCSSEEPGFPTVEGLHYPHLPSPADDRLELGSASQHPQRSVMGECKQCSPLTT